MQKRININKKYSGQVLAVVLVVLFVGVLIALQMMARTERQGDQVQEEDFSATALEVADIGLDAVKGIDISAFIAAVNPDMCNNLLPDQSFYEGGGCEMNWDNFVNFTTAFDLEEYQGEVESILAEECNDDVELESVFSLSIVPMSETDPVEIEKDEVFSIMALSPTVDPACQVKVTTTDVAAAGTDVGAILNPIYATVDGATNSITDFREYNNVDFKGLCLSEGNCSAWGANWENSTETTYPIISGTHSLYELRIRAIGGNVRLTREYINCGDEMYGDMVRVVSDSTCSGTYRGKEFILSREAWAPAIFDYVLFNGQGTLQIQ